MWNAVEAEVAEAAAKVPDVPDVPEGKIDYAKLPFVVDGACTSELREIVVNLKHEDSLPQEILRAKSHKFFNDFALELKTIHKVDEAFVWGEPEGDQIEDLVDWLAFMSRKNMIDYAKLPEVSATSYTALSEIAGELDEDSLPREILRAKSHKLFNDFVLELKTIHKVDEAFVWGLRGTKLRTWLTGWPSCRARTRQVEQRSR